MLYDYWHSLCRSAQEVVYLHGLIQLPRAMLICRSLVLPIYDFPDCYVSKVAWHNMHKSQVKLDRFAYGILPNY